MVTNKELNARREPGCWAILTDKKYYQVGSSCIKRTLRPHEWQSTDDGHLIVPPTTYRQRWKNEAAVLQYLQESTNLPLPRLQCAYEDDGAFYFSTEYVPGVSMSQLEEAQKLQVMEELRRHVETLRSLRSDKPGVPGEDMLCAPYRVTRNRWKDNSCWRSRQGVDGEYVFCHNDLGQHNVLVDPETLKISAIIDWEFSGFWPEWFERSFYERRGPSSALAGEDDDVERCRDWLLSHCDEVVMAHPHSPQKSKPGDV